MGKTSESTPSALNPAWLALVEILGGLFGRLFCVDARLRHVGRALAVKPDFFTRAHALAPFRFSMSANSSSIR